MNAVISWLGASSGDPILDWLSQAGGLGVMAFGVIAFMKGWIVSGAASEKALSEVMAQRDKAMELVYKHAEISMRALEVGEWKK